MTASFCFNSTPGFYRIFRFLTFSKLSNDWYSCFTAIALQKIYDSNPMKTWFSTYAKLSCDIKSLFRKSADKKLKISTSIFPPVLLHFFDSFYNNLIPLSNIFRSQKKLLKFAHYWQSYGHLKSYCHLKSSLHNKKLDFNRK